MAVVYLRKRDGALEELGQTEVIMNCLDPAWIEKINVAYQFEIVQSLVFHVYDVDTSYHNLPVKEVADNNCVYRNEIHHSVGERTQVLQDVAADPTLPRTKSVQCSVCGHGEAVFFQDSQTLCYFKPKTSLPPKPNPPTTTQ